MSLIKYFDLFSHIKKQMTIYIFLRISEKYKEEEIIKKYISKGYRRDDINICYSKYTVAQLYELERKREILQKVLAQQEKMFMNNTKFDNEFTAAVRYINS